MIPRAIQGFTLSPVSRQTSSPSAVMGSGRPQAGATSPRAVRPLGAPGTPGPTSIASYGMEELSHDDMLFLRQMQVQNQRLRQQLGLHEETTVAEAEEALTRHMGQLEGSFRRNVDLRAKLRDADKDLAVVNVSIANLSKEERIALTSGSVTPPMSSTNLPASSANLMQDQAEIKRLTDKVMTDIHEVTRANIDLIREQDEKLKTIEKELSMTRRQHQQLLAQANSRPAVASADMHSLQEQLRGHESQLQALLKNSHDIEEAIKQERQKKSDSEHRTIQKLQTERDVLYEEIENLRRSLEKRPDDEADLSKMIPATSVLSVEACQLQDQLTEANDRGQQEQGALELQVEELRRSTKEYQEKLKIVLAEREKAQAELQILKETRDGAKAVDREISELRAHKESLSGSAGRCRQMIEVYDKKIAELKMEGDDIQRRVQEVAGNRKSS